MSGTEAATALPPDGIDLRAEVVQLQRRRIEQAIARTSGNKAAAARLLGLSYVDFERLCVTAMGGGERPAPRPRSRPPAPALREVSRVENGIELISRDAIRQLSAEGFTPRQIANRFGVSPYFVEKILRAEAELAKCPAVPAANTNATPRARSRGA